MLFHGLMKPTVCEHRQYFQLGCLNFLTQSRNFLAGVGENPILSLENVYDLSKDRRQGE